MSTVLASPHGRLLDFRGACAYLGDMPAARLRRLVAAKKIPAHYDGRLFFLTSELDAWLQSTRRDRPTSSVHVALTPPAPSRPAGDVSDLFSKRRLMKVGGR